MARNSPSSSTTNLLPINLAWLDAHVYDENNKQLLDELRKIYQVCMEFVEEDECKRFLGRGIADPRRFILVVSGALGETLVPEIHEHSNILSIYVYCSWREKHEKWSRCYSKVGYHL
ncbi:unnamed protein product [Rotaria sordida]|uniref:Uncharacterized protein n=1 Tax=Rotaria sordida TaxID=392033 RepID=A0A819K4U7_9BILA|nr:unnamed protein product [Rotaria sordida]